jgi:Fe-S oxidoreductase
MANIEDNPGDSIVTGDASCLTHINGGLQKYNKLKRVRHLADVLAEGLPRHET